MGDCMSAKNLDLIPGHIIFDHDGTLVKTDTSQYTLFAGMRDLLLELKSQNYELYIWTARPRQSTLDIIKKMDIAQFFTELFCYDDGIPKPHAMGLIKLTAGIDKKSILHIGDSPSDIEGAKAYGIEVIAACWNRPNQVNNGLAGANYTANSIEECRQIIKGKFYV